MYISVAGRQAHSLSVNGLGLAKEFFTGHYAASNNKNLALELHESVVWKQVYELCLKPPCKSFVVVRVCVVEGGEGEGFVNSALNSRT